jgi:hypothetical protein
MRGRRFREGAGARPLRYTQAMLKALAVLRALFLVAIAGYTAWAMPWSTQVARTFDEQYARCSSSLALMVKAAWIAIAWIAFETAIGFWMASRETRRRLPAGAPRPGSAEPPFAPPPRH